MRAGAAVGVDDDLAPGEPGVAHGAAGDEPAGRVDVEDGTLAIQQVRGDRRQDHLLDHVRPDPALVDLRRVLGRDHDRLDGHRLAVDVPDRDLALAVRSQVIEVAGLPHGRELLGEPVREHDRERHQLLGLAAGVPEHQALVAGAEVVDAHRDVGRLLVDRGDDAAGLVVEAVLRPCVPDALDRVPRDARDVDVAGGRDLAGDDDEPRGQDRLAGDPARRILGNNRVQDSVGDLIGHLVGMAFGDRLGREDVLLTGHVCSSLEITPMLARRPRPPQPRSRRLTSSSTGTAHGSTPRPSAR